MRRTARLLLLLALCPGRGGDARAQVVPDFAHPSLLFTAAELPALRDKLHDGGDDDAAYAAIRAWSVTALALTPPQLIGDWSEGLLAVGQLGLAAQVEADGDAFAAKTREVVLYVVREHAVDNDEFASALRLQALALGYDLAFAGATAAERDEVRREMRTYLDYMPLHFNYYSQAYGPHTSNHGMTAGAAAGLAAIVLWDEASAAGRDSLRAALAFADQLVGRCLTDILPSDGAYREGVLYAAWIMRVGVPYFEARRRFDATDLAADPRLERMIAWLCYELAPEGGGHTNNLNDSSWNPRPLSVHNTYLEWAQARYRSPLARYLHDHVVGRFGHDSGADADRVATALWCQPIPAANPERRLAPSRLFAERGLYYFRDGWKSGPAGDEVVFSFFSGKFYGGHAQEDQNQFTLAAYGVRWATDCGGVGPTSTPKETEAHNLVLVDGHGQHNAGNSIGTDGHIAATLLTGFADYLRGDARAAYATYSPFNAPGVPFPFSDWSWGYDGGDPLQRADRLCLVVKGGAAPPYVLVADDVRKDAAPHTYDWMLHTSTVPTIDLGRDPALLQAPHAALDLYFAHPRPDSLVLEWAPFVHGGVDSASHRIVARARAVEPRFFVALLPRRADMPPPACAATSDSAATTLALQWGDVRDVAVFDPHHALVTGEVTTDGALVLVRRVGTNLSGYLLGEGSVLGLGWIRLVTIEGGMASVGLAGDTLRVSRSDLAFSAYAPSVRCVLGPDGPMSFHRTGTFVHHLRTADAADRTPGGLWLEAAGPNPARRGALVRFGLESAARVRLVVRDVRGARVATLADARLGPGVHAATWDRRNLHGGRAAAGVYFIVLESNGARRTCKLVVTR